MRWWTVGLLVLLAGCGDDAGGQRDATDADGDAEAGSEICDDWVDNDHDMMLDCADPDCAGFPGCPVCGNDLVEPGEDCEPSLPPATCTTECGSTGTRSCGGFCRWQDECVVPVETCNDVDDDCDGGTDEGVGNCGCDIFLDFEETYAPFALLSTDGDCALNVVPGRTGNAMEVTGSSSFSYTCIARHPDLEDRPMRLSSWVNVPTLPSSTFALAHGFYFNPDGTVQVAGGDAGTWTVGTWYLAELEWNASYESVAWINGMEVARGTTGAAPQFQGAIVVDDFCVRYLD